MRVLLIMDPLIRVPPEHYGGIERVIADLADGLVRRGHDVTLWAAPGSRTTALLESFGTEGEWSRWSNLRNVGQLTARLWGNPSRFDVVHNFGRLAYLTGVFRWNLPKVQTYMRPVNPENMRKVSVLGARRMRYTAVSAAIRDTGLPGGGEWSVIYNCAPVAQLPVETRTNPATSPLVFLGRLERCKGAHTAIDVAKKLGHPLIIAGNKSALPAEIAYFETELKPLIDGTLIKYIGPVNNVQKSELFRGAAALLLPVEWDEPFPVVLPEALLSGTPVIGFRRGGIPEGIEHGRTGFICDTGEQMAVAVTRLGEIDRAYCRAEGERRFSDEAVVDEYEQLYQGVAAS